MYGTRQCILHQCFNASGCYSVEQFNRFISCNSETAQSWKAQADWTIFASLCWHANRVYMQHTIRLHLGVCFICCWEDSHGISMVFFCIFSSLQGFFIFLFYVVRNSEVRNLANRMPSSRSEYPRKLQKISATSLPKGGFRIMRLGSNKSPQFNLSIKSKEITTTDDIEKIIILKTLILIQFAPHHRHGTWWRAT